MRDKNENILGGERKTPTTVRAAVDYTRVYTAVCPEGYGQTGTGSSIRNAKKHNNKEEE